jgi:hypothetical protein
LLGRTILVHAEQGLGDTIQFVRYLTMVKAAGGHVILAADRRLGRILRGVAGVDRFVALGTPMPPFDLHAPLLSLPGVFQTSLGTIPAQVPYLSANRNFVAEMRVRLQPLRGLKVGVCWRGNPENPRDAARSIPVSYIQQLAKMDGIALVSLQKDSDSQERPGHVFEVTKSLDTVAGPFMETAAIIVNLDLVISCDTAVAHLAGALGKPVWLALGHAPDWRWLRDRADSPWYPTMRIFRQTEMGNWDHVFAAIRVALLKLVKTRARSST